mgnify:CR=1 FL=1
MPAVERALVVGLLHQRTTRAELDDHLQELETLVRSAGAEVVEISRQQRPVPDGATFIGRGKVEELRSVIEQRNITLVVFDEELTPVQVRNLERAWKVKVLDRAGVILHIFAERARTQEAKVQVELAQLQYMLPRLSRLWTHLSKQVGGIGTRGPGETQLETDRRLIRRRIQHLQQKLQRIVAQRAQRRRGREQLPRFALVGYTNVGKSTLMRALTSAPVVVEDRLFATLDTTVRRFQLPGGQPALVSDTVGFLRKLPPQLIAAFHSTLAEVTDADVLIHVVDISHPSFRQHMEVVTETLQTLGAAHKPTVLVFNKIDRLTPESPLLEELRYEYPEAIYISAERGINLRRLLAALQQAYERLSDEITFMLPYTELRLLRDFRTSGQILRQQPLAEGLLVHLRCPLAIADRLRGLYAPYVVCSATALEPHA